MTEPDISRHHAIALIACDPNGMMFYEVVRTRRFGLWAAWTGVAGAAGPLLGGGLVDWLSWRALFAMSGTMGLIAVTLLVTAASAGEPRRAGPIPVFPTAALVFLFGVMSYALIEGFQRAMVVCAAIVFMVGLLGGMLLRDDEPGGLNAP